jgi:broad specificity phosphatase PhoE
MMAPVLIIASHQLKHTKKVEVTPWDSNLLGHPHSIIATPPQSPNKFFSPINPKPSESQTSIAIAGGSAISISNTLKKPLLVCALSALLSLGDLRDITRLYTANSNINNDTAEASGLFQMPPAKLSNRYYLVRSGESELEKKGIINTNPVAKTSMDSGLSEEGKEQALKAALELEAMGACEGSCWIWPSITQRAYQAAEIIAAVNNIGRSRIVPEYSFLDARGLGAFEGRDLTDINEIYASDLISPNLKPPPFTDGTPNESVADVFVRVTQLMSILETQYSSENIIIVSPDSDNLTILQAGLTGLDLRR